MVISITSLQTFDIKDILIVGQYSRACGSYNDLLDRGLLLTRKLLNQGFLVVTLKSLLRKLDGRHHDLPNRWSICVINDQIYVPLGVIKIRFGSWLVTGFVLRVTRRVSHVEQELLALLVHLSSPRF
jgi:hypothetical protein